MGYVADIDDGSRRSADMCRKIMACIGGSVAFRRLIRVMLVCVCALAWGADGATQSAEPRVTILVYHRFSDTADDSMTVRMSTYETQ